MKNVKSYYTIWQKISWVIAIGILIAIILKG